MQRRMKARILCLSLALENPHQALDAYMNFATATARKISCSESSHKREREYLFASQYNTNVQK